VNDPFNRTRPVLDGFAAVATFTPANLLLVLVVVKFLATGSPSGVVHVDSSSVRSFR
jgi:hypothetical protein